MRHGAKRLISLLTALVLVGSFVAVSASVAEAVTCQYEGVNGNKWYSAPFDLTLPTVTLSSGQTQTKYIFANSKFNSAAEMPKCADIIKGTYNGKEVELIPVWTGPKKDENLFNGLKGSTGNDLNGYFDSNTFTATTFIVKDTGQHVQAASDQKATLSVWVIAVDANLSCKKYNGGKISVTKSEALAVQKEDDLAKLLKLPTQAKVTYTPEQVSTGTENLTKKAQNANPFKQADGKCKITGWEMVGYSGLNLTPERLGNLAGEVTDKNKEITLRPYCENPPEWATVKQEDMLFHLTITPDPQAVVTVMPPDDITYGQTLDKPSAKATLGGQPVPGAKFAFTYEGIDGTMYAKNTIPPTGAGKYQVTAALTTLGYSGFAAADFTISKDDNGTAKAYISVPDGSQKTIKIDETFIPSGMAKGAKIKAEPAITSDGKLIESCTAQVGAAQFTLKSKSDAPDGSTQTFTLVLESDNYGKVDVSVTVNNDNVAITGAKLKGDKTEFESGTALKEIVDLSDCSATVNGSTVTGSFKLTESDKKLTGPDTYTNWSGQVLFTSKSKTYQATVSVPDFTIRAPAGGDGIPDDVYLKNGYFMAIYVNSKYNQNAQALLSLVQERMGSYTLSGKTYDAVWRADSSNPAFEPKGYKDNVWYGYTATLTGRSERPKVYVRVIPVNATPSMFNGSSSKIMKAAEVKDLTEQNWKNTLGLPSRVIFKNEPLEEVEHQYEEDKFQTADQRSGCDITGWKMDGSDLTLDALKSKAAGVVNGDVKVTLTPVYTALSWATVKGTAPTFQLTLTSKTPVDVTWSGPASPVTYGETFTLGTPYQTEKDNGGTDPAGTWTYVYYKADGTTRLGQQPANVGKYKVQAVLSSATHSGASELMEFEIKAKSIDGVDVTFTPPAGSLIYNKRPQTPQYTVKDGGTVLKKSTDYMVKYGDNTNAGTAKVTFTGIGNYIGTKEESFEIGKLSLTTVQNPVIIGTVAAGQVLSASLAGVDSDELEWIWKVDGAQVAGGTASYEVKPEDSNKVITIAAKAKENGNYIETSGDSDSQTVAKLKAAGTVTVTAAGTDADGKIAKGTKLTARASEIPSAAANGGTWSWKVDGTIKAGAEGRTYTVETGDKEIIAVFTPGPDYTGSMESAVVRMGKILLTGTVSVTRDPADTDPMAVGSKLTAAVSGGPKSAVFTYTWLCDGEPISGASGKTYTVTAADRGKIISVKATADGYTGQLVSDGTNIPAAAPGAPANVKATADDRLLDISWSVPADSGGAPVTGYKLTVTQSGDSKPVSERSLAANVLSYRLEGLANGTEYSVSVRAVNKNGTGEEGRVIGTPEAPTVSVTVKKVWKLDNGRSAANSVMAVLLRNGKEYGMVELNSHNGWTYTWSKLSGGDNWTVDEANVPEGFTAKVDQDGMTFTITNDDKPDGSGRTSGSGKPANSGKSSFLDKLTNPGKSAVLEKLANLKKLTDQDESADDGSQRGDESNFLQELAGLIIFGVVMIAIVLNRRRKYREKLRRK